MNLSLRQKASIRWKHGILYSFLLLVVPVSLPLGMVAAAMGAWFAIQGGSLIYLPLGLALLLAGVAIVRSRSIADLSMLALLVFAAFGWSFSGSDVKSRLLSSLAELSGRFELLLGLLACLAVALVVLQWHRIAAAPTGRSRLRWGAIPLLVASVASLLLAYAYVR